MGEKKVGVVPKVVIAGALGPKEYGLLLTDQRMIFVLEKASKMGVGAVLGGVIGAAIAEAATDRREYVYADADPSVLAQDEKNLVVTHSSIQKIRIKKNLGGAYQMIIEYANEDGKSKKLGGFLNPPGDLLDKRKAEGVKSKIVIEEYARRAQEALKLALPPSTVMNSEWLT